jgi:hypothetical protein
MRKLISNGLATFLGIVSVPATVHNATRQSQAPEYRIDPRLKSLQKFFQRGAYPVGQFSADFLEAADHNNLDWRLLPSLAVIESSGGKNFKNNNVFGWNNGEAVFPSVKAGIHSVADRLANSKHYRDKDLQAMLETYNPNAEYSVAVKSVMRRIAPSDKM